VGDTQDKDDVDFVFVECRVDGCRVFGHGVGDLFSLEIFICHRTNVPCTLAVATDWAKEGVEREREVEGGLRWEGRTEGKVDDAVVTREPKYFFPFI
jgi:hypothetical protein